MVSRPSKYKVVLLLLTKSRKRSETKERRGRDGYKPLIMEPGTEDWADKVTLEGVHKLQKKIQGTCNAIKKSQVLKSFLEC